MEHNQESTDLHMSPLAAEQFSYHLMMATTRALSGEAEESTTETVLAWAILCQCCPQMPDAARRVAGELVDPSFVGVAETQREHARVRAQDLALSLEAHFTSVGLHEHASLYESVVGELASAIGVLGHVSG